MFGEWSGEDLAQLYFQEETPESTRFKEFFRVRDLDIVKALLLPSRRDQCGQAMTPQGKVHFHYDRARWLKTWLVGGLRRTNVTKLVIRDIIYGTGLWRSKALMAWIERFSPDSVFFVGGNSIFSFRIAGEISSAFNVPLDVFITDDYVLNAQPQGLIARRLHHNLVESYRSTFQTARNVFVIGDEMASAFREVFGREFAPVMNAVALPSEIPRRQPVAPADRVIDIVYAGGLHLGRDQSLVRFATLMQKIAKRSGLAAQLSVYSLQPPSTAVLEAFAKAGVVFGGALNQDGVSERLQKADFVLHVESFETRYVNMTKLSVSTKIPEYLASGACLIAFGPAELASIRLVANNAIGVTLSDQDSDDQIQSKLQGVFLSTNERDRLAACGFAFAKKKFSTDVVRHQLGKLINGV